MDKLTIISGCLFLAADIFAIASIANPDWINTGESAGALTVGLVRQCQTIHGRDRTCIPPRLPPEWVTTLFFIIMGIISLTVTCGLLVASHWRREATKYARWIAFTGKFWFFSQEEKTMGWYFQAYSSFIQFSRRTESADGGPKIKFQEIFHETQKILELDEIQKSASSVSIFQMKKSRPQKSRLSSLKSHNSRAGTPHRKKCL
ncbi:modulator of smoothened protein isoform X1 [Lutra lutra]|uniref:modulator of smoothened protein isoform X1 n=1 Tax=Lutra lutra TaxID=9657 RepID=UPI001FD405E1|nr:modulator of smoothened protein isoform X1 [Lutra lutra]